MSVTRLYSVMMAACRKDVEVEVEEVLSGEETPPGKDREKEGEKRGREISSVLSYVEYNIKRGRTHLGCPSILDS